MKARLPIIWLALLTIFQSYTITDMSSTLKDVEANQEHTLHYMEKSAKILKRIKNGDFTVSQEKVDIPARAGS